MPPVGFKTLTHSLTLSLLLSDWGPGLLSSLHGVSLSLSLSFSVGPSLVFFFFTLLFVFCCENDAGAGTCAVKHLW